MTKRGASENGRRHVVIYCRYSSDRQRDESNLDQERRVRETLVRLGVDTTDVTVIKDRAMAGSLDARPGFQQVLQMMHRDEIGVLAVDEMSRLSRGSKTKALIEDLVFHGGRFIAVIGGVDTTKEDWEILAGFREMQGKLEGKTLGKRIRRGVEGRLLDHHGAAGDHPFGYDSVFADANWQQEMMAGRKPKKKIVINEDEAKVVRRIFCLYGNDQLSMHGIAILFNRERVANGHRSGATTWNTTRIRNMLECEKYVGVWRWGMRCTLRDSGGKIRRRLTPKDQWIVLERPELRIVDQATWDTVRHRRPTTWFSQPGSLTGQVPLHPRHAHPDHNLGGLIKCPYGHRLGMMYQFGKRYLACRQHQTGLCKFHRSIQVCKVEEAIYKFLTSICAQWPEWMESVKRSLYDSIHEATNTAPADLEAMRGLLKETQAKIGRLIEIQELGGSDIASLSSQLRKREDERLQLHLAIVEREKLAVLPMDMPDDAWLRKRLAELPSVLGQHSPAIAALLKVIFSEATMVEIMPGIKAGPLHLRVKLNTAEVLAYGLGPDWHTRVSPYIPNSDDNTVSPEFTLEVQKGSRLCLAGEKVAELRAKGYDWNKAARGAGLQRAKEAQTACRYWLGASVI